ncbi:HEPN domain-containing protein [Streptomyces scabiei]|uniref:ApeA N-terminal domain 1-containing protein n=1 Tax=Streptomyces scabiei TaxID=1930 RepID=UPI0038F7AEB8
MEAFESDGLFWLPDQEEEQVAGRVTFDPAKGTRLSLIGSFSGSTFGDQDSPQFSTIHGVAGKRFLTFVGCTQSSSRFESPGFHREDYRADFMFAGQALLGPDAMKFDRFSVRFNNLYDWVGQSSVSRQHTFDPASGKLIKAGLTLTPMQEIEYAAQDCTISLSGVWKILGSKQKPGFEEDFSIRVEYDDPVDFGCVKTDIAALQDLLTATTDSVSVPTEITLWTPLSDGDDDARRSYVKAYGQQTAYALVKETRPGDVLLRLGDIGGLEAVARWFDFVRSRRIILGLMLSSKYSKMYTENKFFNAVSAAETLHRMEFPNEVRPAGEYKNFRRMLVRYVPKNYRSWLSQQLAYSNEPRLRHRLFELAEYGGLPTVIGCDAHKWAKAVTDARNRMVHHDKGKGPGASSAELYWLAESLKLMILLCLAKFCEFQDGYQGKLQDAASIQFLAERVSAIMGSQTGE